jgi:hypothetical protein
MMTCEEVRLSLGVHALGALEPDEAVLVEAHLAECEACAAEFEELAGVSTFLSRATEADVLLVASPPKAVLHRLIDGRARRHRRMRLLLVAAGSVGVLVFGGAVWAAMGGPGERSVSTVAQDAQDAAAQREGAGAAPEEAAAANPSEQTLADAAPAESDMADPKSGAAAPESEAGPAERQPKVLLQQGEPDLLVKGAKNGVRATVRLFAGGGGSSVQIDLSGVRTGTRGSLIAVGTDGSTDTAASWMIGPTQYGHVSVFPGHTSFAPDQIRSFEVVTAAGDTLLTIKVP